MLKSSSMDAALVRITRRIGAIPLLMIVALAMMLPGFATLPPMDRDEPRFAQASKQMLESGDYVEIRFGEEARNKKPVGIHWMQAAVVGAADRLHVPDARRLIWLYRLPSLAGALCAVALTYWAALAFVSWRGAVAAGLLMAATPLLGAEARLATTDAVLAATVTAALGAFARAYLDYPLSRRASLGIAAVFWTAVGIGILIKGPINPMIPAFAAAVLWLRDRSASWMRGLRPLAGIVLCLLLVAPWFVLIFFKTHGAFFTEAVGHDLLGKVAGAQEMHGAPPGFYLAAFWLTGWPTAPFVAVTAPLIWQRRRDPRVVLLLAWIVPAWVLFEATPTKLVHYALPLYPAVAILAAFGLEQALHAGRAFTARQGMALFLLLALLPAVMLGVVVAGQGTVWRLGAGQTAIAMLAMALSGGIAWKAGRALVDGDLDASPWIAAAAALPVYLFVFGWLLSPAATPALAVAPRLARAASEAMDGTCPTRLYATVGSREPSLMFVTDSKLLMTDPVGAARFLAEGPCRVAFVEGREEEAFRSSLDPALPVRETARVAGIAINGGRQLDIGVYMRQ